jgi:hypothetical protein
MPARDWHRPAPLALLILAAGSTLALVLMDATPLSTDFGSVIFALFGLVIVWAVIGVGSATLYVRRARRREWKQSFLPGVLLALSLLVAFNFFPFVRGCGYLGGALRFALTRSYYEHEIALVRTDGKPKLVIFNWGGMIWASTGVVYDESDEVALPPGQQSAAWMENARRGELGCGNWDARRLSSHYYLVGFAC